MPYQSTPLAGVYVFNPVAYNDARGFFFESFNERHFLNEVGFSPASFVQDNHSHSIKGVLRGMHYQIQCPQGKFVRVIQGAVFDVAVDLRKSSTTFGKWFGIEISQANKKALWIPPGFAHGFLTLTESADFLYKTTDYWAPEHERTLRFDDPKVNIEWPKIDTPLLMSLKDQNSQFLETTEIYENL